MKYLMKSLAIMAGALALLCQTAQAQQVTPRWGYLFTATNITNGATYTLPTNSTASLVGQTGKTNNQVDLFKDHDLTLWLYVAPTNAASTSSNAVVTIVTTPNGTLWTSSDFVWSVPYNGTNGYWARTNLTRGQLGAAKSLRCGTVVNGWSNTVPIGPLIWSLTP